MPVKLPTINQLDSSQKEVVNHIPYDDPMFVKGPPGSGKTHIAILRLNVLLQNGYTNVLFLLYNHSMYGFLSAILGKMNLKNNIEIDTKDLFFASKAKQTGYLMYEENRFDDYTINYNKRLVHLEKISSSSLPKYNIVVVDECQDFSERELKLLNKMTDKIMAVGDFEQSVYVSSGQTFLKSLPTRQLNTIYRYGKNVASIAEYFATTSKNLVGKVTNDDKTDVYKVKASNRPDAVEKIVRLIKAKKETDMNIAIISLSKNQLTQMSKELSNRNVETYYCENNKELRNYDFEKKLPLLITPLSAKGMEFDCVILFGYDSILHYGSFDDNWREIVYVSLTRTSNELYLIQEPETIPDLKNLSEWVEIDPSIQTKRNYDF